MRGRLKLNIFLTGYPNYPVYNRQPNSITVCQIFLWSIDSIFLIVIFSAKESPTYLWFNMVMAGMTWASLKKNPAVSGTIKREFGGDKMLRHR